MPRERFGLDLAYNFNSVIQNALICFNDTPPTPMPTIINCGGNDTSSNLMANSYYANHTNFGMATVRFKPAKRVLANVGYSISSVDGRLPWILAISWHTAWAGIITSTAKVHLSARARHAIFTPIR